MARRSSRRSRRARGPIGTLYSPIHHGISAGRNVIRSGIGVAGSIVDTGLGGIDNAASSVASHANMTLRNIYKGTIGGRRRSTRRRGGRRRSTRRKY